MDAMSVEDVRLEADDAGFSFDALPPELAPLFLERLAFPHLLSLRLCCQHLNMLSMGVTRLTLTRREQLYLPLLKRFVGVQSLTLEDYQAQWVPRLACVLGIFPRLLRLRLVKAKAQATALQLQTDGPVLALVGALQAGACPNLFTLSLDERLSEDHAMLVAEAMVPDGGLLFATIQAHRADDGPPPPHLHPPPPLPPPLPLPLRLCLRLSASRPPPPPLDLCLRLRLPPLPHAALHPEPKPLAGARGGRAADARAWCVRGGGARGGGDAAHRRRLPHLPRHHDHLAAAEGAGERTPQRRRHASHYGCQPRQHRHARATARLAR